MSIQIGTLNLPAGISSQAVKRQQSNVIVVKTNTSTSSCFKCIFGNIHIEVVL